MKKIILALAGVVPGATGFTGYKVYEKQTMTPPETRNEPSPESVWYIDHTQPLCGKDIL